MDTERVFVEDLGSTTDDLILDLSLASSFPVGVDGQDLFAGTASMQVSVCVSVCICVGVDGHDLFAGTASMQDRL